MPWFKVDDSFAGHPKRLGVSLTALGLWVAAGAWCAQQLTDGHVPRHVLTMIGGRQSLADELVGAGLWVTVEGGWRFHDWSDYQPTRAETEARRAARAEAGHRGGLASARSKRQASATANAKQVLQQTPSTRLDVATDTFQANVNPDPTRPVSTVVNEVSHLKVRGSPGDSTDLETIARATRGDHAHARRVARDVLAKAKTPPADPTAYVLAAVRDDPARYRSSAPTTVARCAEHDIELPCGACAADRKASR